MTGYAIKVEHLSKLYALIWRRRSILLRDVLQEIITPNWGGKGAVGGSAVESRGSGPTTFGALRDVSFEIAPGERVGIIGSNGAGKTTLLKILAQVTAPTKGRVRLRGRVGSLLEVGTGFHTELTGRENIYLNGAVLGMRKHEIDRKFDEIVSFAEVEDFLDATVKFYSSGMSMRLAFSVAAHLEPEILLIDEVLAVGDVVFQRKCLRRMEEVAHDGRTVLFVSHRFAHVKALCPESMVLERGALTFFGDTGTAIQKYLTTDANGPVAEETAVAPSGQSQVLTITTEKIDGSEARSVAHDEPFFVHVKVQLASSTLRAPLAHITLRLQTEAFDTILESSDFEPAGESVMPALPGDYEFRIQLPGDLLSPGKYFVTAQIWRAGTTSNRRYFDQLGRSGQFEVYDNGSLLTQYHVPWQGPIHVPLRWTRLDSQPESLERQKTRPTAAEPKVHRAKG